MSLQSDALLSLLEELAQAGGCDISPTDNNQQHSTEQPEKLAVVGPKAEELESIKELIRFDHVYYKPDQPKVATVVKSSQPTEENVPVVDLTAENDNVVELFDVTESDVSSVEQNSANEEIPDTFDIDNILELLTTDTVSVVAGDSGEKDTDISKEEPAKKRQKVSDNGESVQNKNIELLPEHFDFNTDYDLGFQQDLVTPHSPLARSPSESGYSSDGGIPSPKSDISSPLSNEWEESFTQLFPSLF